MKLTRQADLRLLVPSLSAWVVTAFGGLLVPLPWAWLGAAGCALGAAGLLLTPRCRGRPGRRLLALTLAACALVLVAAAGHRTLRGVGPLTGLAAERAVVTLRGQLSADPAPVGGPTVATPNGTRPATVVVRVDVETVTARGRTTQLGAPVLLLASAAYADLEWRDRIEVVVRLRPAEPGDDVVAVATPRGPPSRIGSPAPVLQGASAMRERFRAATDSLWPDARGLVPALVVGDRSRTPPDLTEAMLATGMSHLSAVSGSNVTIVLAAALGLCRALALRRRWRPWVAMGVLAAFVILARPEPSVIRAAVMGAVGLVGLSASRRRVGLPALAAAVLALLVWDPWLSRSYGFALSSVATLGLLVFAQPWGSALERWLPTRARSLGPVLAVPVAAQAVCAPIVVPLQGSVSLVAVVANLLTAPLVAPATIVGVAVAVLAVVWIDGAALLAWVAAVPAEGIAQVARRGADAPFGSVGWGTSAAAAVLLAAVTALVILAAPWLWRHVRLRPVAALLVLFASAAFVLPTSLVGWPPPGWIVVGCDVGQGDGWVVGNGAGHAVVIDAGAEPDAIDGCLHRLGVEVVDLLVMTHLHADHAGGVAGVLRGRRVTQLRLTTVRDPPQEFARVSRLAAAAGVPVGELRAGDAFEVGSVSADVWSPGREITAGSVPNNNSLVMTVRVGGVGILFTGDMEREAGAEVLRAARRDPTRWGVVDVLKVAHHGSSNRDDELVRYVSGRLALISVGTSNDYGHPAPSTLSWLRGNGFRVHRTDLEGDLALVRQRAELVVVGRGRGP